jgi:hypothetical protein
MDLNDIGSDDHEKFGGNFTGGFYIQQNPKEIADVINFLKDKNIKTYCEIGTAACGLVRLMDHALGLDEITIIDDGKHDRFEHAKKNLSHVKARLRQCIANTYSKEARMFLADINRKFDVVFIDAGHKMNDVRNDFKLVYPYAKKYVIFHDYIECVGVTKAVDDFVLGGQLKEVKLIYDQGKHGMGIFIGEVL